jgi:hypothetical protein
VPNQSEGRFVIRPDYDVPSTDEAALAGSCYQDQRVGKQGLIPVSRLELAPTEAASSACREHQCVKRQMLSVCFGLASLLRLV